MFSGEVGQELEQDPLQVRYGSVVRGVQQRHFMNLKLLLDKALASAPYNMDQKRIAFAISEVLFKICPIPGIGLIHRVLGLMWDQYAASSYMRNVKELFSILVCH